MNFLKYFFFLFFVVFSLSCIAGPINEKDSLKRDSLIESIRVEKDYNKTKVLIINLLNTNFVKDPKFVIKYVEENLLDNPKYKTDTIFYANILNSYGNSFQFIDLNKSAEILKRGIDHLGNNKSQGGLQVLSILTVNLANTIGALGNPMTNLKMLQDLSPTILRVRDTLSTSSYHLRIAGLYYDFNEPVKSIDHYRKVVFRSNDLIFNPSYSGLSELMLASNYLKLGVKDSLVKYIRIADKKKLPELAALHKSRLKSLLGLSEAYNGNYQTAFQLIDQAIMEMSDPNSFSELEILYGKFIKSKVYGLQGDYKKSIELLNKIYDESISKNLHHYRSYFLKDLIASYKKTGQLEEVVRVSELLVKFLQDQKDTNQDLYLQELDYTYKFNEKINEIDKLKSEKEKAEITKQRNNLFIFSLLSFLILLSVVLFLVIKAHKRNKLLSMREFDLLKASLEEEKNNRLISEMQLLMQIEDRERNRIATDLHDSIGGLLSSIKISIFNYQESRDLPPSDIEETDRIIEYLDESKQELNRIVYNLTPIIVEKFGLLESIKQYCKKVQNDKFKINLQLISVPTNLVSEDEITLYRIIQENIHNIIKHSNATKALLQIQTDDKTGMVVISIEDNGVGFDLEKAKIKGGLGMRSLYSRVQNLNGTIKIDSKLDEGTSVFIVCYPRIRKEDN